MSNDKYLDNFWTANNFEQFSDNIFGKHWTSDWIGFEKYPNLTPLVLTQMDGCWFHSRQKRCSYPSKKTVYQSDPWLRRYKLVKGVMGSSRVVPGRSYSVLSVIYERTSLHASRSARNKS